MKLNGPSQLVKNENVHLLTAAFDHTDHTLKTYYQLVKTIFAQFYWQSCLAL